MPSAGRQLRDETATLAVGKSQLPAPPIADLHDTADLVRAAEERGGARDVSLREQFPDAGGRIDGSTSGGLEARRR